MAASKGKPEINHINHDHDWGHLIGKLGDEAVEHISKERPELKIEKISQVDFQSK
jgi:hypothetical protein